MMAQVKRWIPIMRRLALPAGVILSAQAMACSPPTTGERAATSLELTAEADVIALARVRSGLDFEAAMRRGFAVFLNPPAMKFEILSLLKGKSAPRLIAMDDGYVSKSPIWRSDMRDLRMVQIYGGSCYRAAFVMGQTVILFLKRDGQGRLEVMKRQFARTMEDVEGPQGLWAKTVRDYVAISSQPRSQWRDELLRRSSAYRALSAKGDKDAAEMADDMIRQANDIPAMTLDDAGMDRLIRRDQRLGVYTMSLIPRR